MNPVATLFLAFAMSTDAFAAAIGKGATLHRPGLREALKAGVIFGVIEALTPLVGWLLGRAAAQYVSAWDHWIAFVLLSILGARMVLNGLSTQTDEVTPKPVSHSLWLLALTGFATSIDAMAVGAGLAFVDVNIYATALAIGLATTAMVTMGVMLGRVIGHMAGKRAEMIGGIVLAGIGLTILLDHLKLIA